MFRSTNKAIDVRHSVHSLNANETRASRAAGRGAFTVPELIVILVILAVVVAIVAPRYYFSYERDQINLIMRTVRGIENAARLYFAEHKSFPAEAKAGEYPADFQSFLEPSLVAQPPHSGGQWDWDGVGAWEGIGAGISICADNPPFSMWRELDRQFDDGDLFDGSIRVFSQNHLHFDLVESAPSHP